MLLEAIGGFKVGVELGVQSGGFAGIMLNTWKSCDKYYLVDLWSQQNNYHDWANVDNATQEKVMNDAKNNLKQWESKTVFIRNYTSAALPFVPGLVDFIYVDARHDYCGAWEDMTLWWPKLRTGGIMVMTTCTLPRFRVRTGANVWMDQWKWGLSLVLLISLFCCTTFSCQ